MILLLLMAATAESLNVLNWVKMVAALDQITLCIGLTALVRAIIMDPMKTLVSQAGFFTWMVGQNFYQTWGNLNEFSQVNLTDKPLTAKLFSDF